MKTTLKEIAEMLDGGEYREMDPAAIKLAKENGIVIVHGSSDDLVEFDGALVDEAGAGDYIYLNTKGIIEKPDCDCEWAMKYYEDLTSESKYVLALNGGDCNPKSFFRYETNVEFFETFKVMEDDQIYCVGLVFYKEHLR